jgi:flagellar protein FliS
MSRAAQAYKNTDINTAVSSANANELILLVYRKIIDNLNIGKKELENNRNGIDAFSKVTELINQGLIASLDYQKGGEIAQNLRKIYLWAMHMVIEARLTNSHEKIDEIINIFNGLSQSWESIKIQKS